MSAGAAETVLVTGAAGFLGRATVELLRRQGRPVVAVDVVARGELPRLTACDLTDYEAVHGLFERERPSAVLHYAAYAFEDAGLLASAERNAAKAVDVNLNGLRHVLRACQEAGVRRLAWSSSTTVYGPPQLYGAQELLDEDACLAPFTLYGATKMLGERISRDAFEGGQVRAVGLRLPLIYGPGRWYGGAQKELMAFIGEVLAGTRGSYSFSDAPTDWMYVDDAVEAMLAVVDAAEVSLPIYNIVGHVDSPYAIAREVVDQAGDCCTVERSLAGPPSILVDGRRFAEEFGIRAKVDRREGIRRYLERLSESRESSRE
ncbi:MAG: NAD(P)-dependent oxidoreductase [Trueperaceae bacterium]